QHEIAVADVSLDHRLAADAERKDVLPAARQGRRRDRHFALAIFLGQERCAGGDPAEDRHGVVAARRAGDVGQSQGARRPPGAWAPLELTLALEGAQVIERGARRDPEPLAELPHRRRYPVLRLEAAHEAQYLALPARQLTHPLPP